MNTPVSIELSALARQFELCARQMHAINHDHGLYPAQWTILRYLAAMPEERRTSAETARYQHLAVGAVTRTVRTLITKGLISKRRSKVHHRAEQLDLTESGAALLRQDPFRAVDHAIRGLPETDQAVFSRVLGTLNAVMQGIAPDAA